MSTPSKRTNVEKDEDEMIAMSSLARSGRRASISMPQGLDLLVKLAEYSWQPDINSSFDDLVEAGRHPDASPKVSRVNLEGNVAIVPPARRRAGYQPQIPGRHPGPQGSTKTGFYEEDEDDEEEDPPPDSEEDQGSEVSETELAKRVSMNPSPRLKPKKGKRGLQFRTPSNSEEDTDLEEIATALKPLAARRKGSVAPPPIRISNSNFNHSNPHSNGMNGHKNGYGDEEKGGGGASPTPSATSLSSLLREKFGQIPIPGMFRNKKPKQYKLQAFVSILFLTIIVLVGSIYIIHKEKELQKSYFDRIRFSSRDRRIRVANIQDRIVLSGVLGVNLGSKDKPWPCLPEHQRENETCLEWMDKGRLYLKTKAPPPKGVLPVGVGSSSASTGNSILCYGIYWEALGTEFPLKDCYDMGENRFFYGGGETAKDQWPLNKTIVPYMPFLTGNKMDSSEGTFQWGGSLRRYFVNSEGAAIKITDNSPLYVSINHPNKKEICFGASYDDFGYQGESPEQLPFLNYTICTAENVLEISKRLADKDIWERLKHEDAQLSYFLAEYPIWRLRPEILDQGNQSDVALLNHTDKIAEIQSEGFILLDETWQQKIGDLEGDPDRFPNLAETFNITKRRGFKIALTVQPFFSTQSKNYENGLKEGVWITEKPRDTPFGHISEVGVPALTKYKQWNSVAVLDVTNERARSWYHDQVKSMTSNYGIEALYADMGTCLDLPQYYRFSELLPSADHAKNLFLQTLRKLPYLSTIGVSTAVKLPKPPTFVALSPTESSWAGLQTLIPNILTLGLAGFPFLIPGSIGGDYFRTPSSANNQTENEAVNVTKLPDRELYIRWLQLAHFLPVVQYSFLPNDYDEEVTRIAKDLGKDRTQKIYPFLKKAMDEALTTGMPIIRPLWMIDPIDPNCLRVSDEFVIGEDIIVAPITKPNSTERDIYLPRGIWKDELERSSTKGERWLHNYKVRHNQIPYFIKLPDTGQILSR